MASFFLEIFNLSMAACWIIGAVFTVRTLFVKSMPKWLVCCLWGLVAIRLLLPVTVESNISLVPNQQLELYIPSEDVDENSVFVEESVPTKEEAVNDSTVKVPITNETVSSPVIDEAVSSPVIDEAVSAPVTDENISVPEQNTVIGDQNNVQNGINENGNIQNTVQTQSPIRKNQISVSFVGIAAIVWAVGFCIMTLYSVLSYILLKRRVRMSFPCGDKVRKGEGIDSPFVLGFLRPRIYIPFGLSQRTEECVIAHERAHLARRDYIIKPLAFLILSVHWFNPFVWVAYILLCRDIEYACDERVVKGLDTDERKAYAFALLECAISHRRIAACPVAFGETGVKERVKNTMKYKKPAFWIIVICVIVCITVAVLFLTTGVSESDNSDTSSETSDNAENGVYTQVDSFINEGKFEEAYKLLLTVKSEQKAKDMLKDFLVVRETESQYGRGNNGTGLIDELKTEYDANGNPVKITKLGSNRDIQTVTQMSYDKDNNLLSKDIYYSGAEKPKISIKYTYDENGWLIKEFHTDRSENSLNLEQTFEYVYDSHGNVVEKRTTNYFGFAAVDVVKYVLKYDEKGRLIEKYNEEEPEYVTYYSYYDDGTLKKEESGGWLKEYDENGNIVKSDTGDEKDDYVYNADGKLLKHTCDDGKTVTVYEYTYDENGYLVKKTADSDEYGVTTWQYYNDAYGNPEKMALTYDSGKDDGYIYHYRGYKYFYRPQKKSEGNSEKNPNGSVQKDYIDGLFAAEFVEYKDLGKYQNCTMFESSVEYNVMSVLITPKTTIYDFKIYSLEDNIDTVTLENILFEAKSISADKPLLAEIEFGDILAENGISFTDENGNTHLYKLVDNAYDGKLIVYDVTVAPSEESKGETSEPEISEPEISEPEISEPENHVHVYGEWETTVNATCVASGTEERVCSCGEKDSRSVAKLSHNYTETTIAATCKEQGYVLHKCDCGSQYKDNYTAKTYEHSFPRIGANDGYNCAVCGLKVCAYGNYDGTIWSVDRPIKYYITGGKNTIEERTLVIYGTGAIPDKSDYATYWNNPVFNDEIKHIVIAEGITSIGARCFYSGQSDESMLYSSVRSISIPSTVTHIGDYAFYDVTFKGEFRMGKNVRTAGDNFMPQGCSVLYVPRTLQSINHDFSGWIYYEGSKEEFAKINFYDYYHGSCKYIDLYSKWGTLDRISYSAW